MELLDYPNPGTMENRVFSTAVTHGAGTLVQPAGAEDATGTGLGVGFATRYHHDQDTSQCCYYNDSDSPYRTAMMTFFKSGSSARTTFTPPAGTWRLKARLAENGQTPVHSLSATATLGGETVSLGAVDPATKLLSEFRFADGTIAVDGETPVTLTLTASVGDDGIWADDFRLVARQDAAELVEILLAPALSTASALATSRIPPPTVNARIYEDIVLISELLCFVLSILIVTPPL